MLYKLATVIMAITMLLTALAGCSSSTGNSTEYGNRVGNLAYEFSLTDLNGDSLLLSSLLGQPVMLNFWDTA